MKLIGKSAAIAKKYAKAFMRVAGSRFTLEDYNALGKLEVFLRENPHIMLVFRVPLFDDVKKAKFLRLLLERFALSEHVQALCNMLLVHDRVMLMGRIFYMIRKLYQKEHNMMFFVITSSHQLEAKKLEKVQNFLAHKTGRAILYTYTVDNKLISGIRAQSDTLLWECSIRQRLRIARHALVPV